MMTSLQLISQNLKLKNWEALTAVYGFTLPNFGEHEIEAYVLIAEQLADLPRIPTNVRLDSAINATAVLARHAGKDVDVHRWLYKPLQTSNPYDGMDARSETIGTKESEQRFFTSVTPSFAAVTQALNWICAEVASDDEAIKDWPHTGFTFLGTRFVFDDAEKKYWLQNSKRRLDTCFLRNIQKP